MKIKTFIEASLLGSNSQEKVDSPHCYCPLNGRKVDCSAVCVKCEHFRWFNIHSISCLATQKKK